MLIFHHRDLCSYQMKMSDIEQEVNYTPTKWSKRFDRVQILTHYYQFGNELTENARRNLKCELDVPYGITERTKYDIYGTDLPKDSPVFVFIHGGYWQEGDKDSAAFAAPVFVRKGIKVIIIGYDLCPNVKLEDIILQIKTAVEHVLKSSSDSGCRNVWISGHSAGAHLAASLLFDKMWINKMAKQGYLKLLNGVVLISGVFNLNAIVNTSFGVTLRLTQGEIDAYSFTTLNVDSHSSIRGLKVILAVGECDAPGLINESRECTQKLVTLVDNIQYLFLRGNIDHFDIVEKLTDTEFVLTKTILNNVLHE